MLTLMAAFVIQSAASGIILSDDPPAPVIEVPARPIPQLPPHATTDPFGWERSQCSPYIRKDEPLEHCQIRVRSDLLAVMGERLPPGLRPASGLENCTPGNAENNYQLQCGPRQLMAPASAATPQDRLCQNQPERQPNGSVVVREVCRTDGSADDRSKSRGLTIFSRD